MHKRDVEKRAARNNTQHTSYLVRDYVGKLDGKISYLAVILIAHGTRGASGGVELGESGLDHLLHVNPIHLIYLDVEKY
jgi:hypothetical protein